MGSRISSLDVDYATGDLSLYPEQLDNERQLYQAKNNAETALKQTLTFSGQNIIVNDATGFPDSGLLRISAPNSTSFELIYYDSRSSTVFTNLIRGFASSTQNTWPAYISIVSSGVMADYHNAIKDSLINIEQNLGLQISPSSTSLNGILQGLESKYLAPEALFRAYPLSGIPPLTVTFQNFSNNMVRYFWDFGDGVTSLDRNATHTYTKEGIYTVKLNVITSLGTQGITIKSNYITVSNDEVVPFAYAELGVGPNYTYDFVDQTDGPVQQRFWYFGDGQITSVTDPNSHATTHTYITTGTETTYSPTLVIVFQDQTIKRAFLNPITIPAT